MSDLDAKSAATPAIVPPEVEISGCERYDERHREAYRLRRAGHKVSTIAAIFAVDVRTIHRWLDAYHDSYRKSLEETTRVNLIAIELAKLEELEQSAREGAATTKSEEQQRGFLALALKAIQVRQQLLLDVGVLPREPTKIYSTVQELNRPLVAPHTEEDCRSDEEIRGDLLELMKFARKM